MKNKEIKEMTNASLTYELINLSEKIAHTPVSKEYLELLQKREMVRKELVERMEK